MLLSRSPFPRSYAGKILLAVSACVHAPLLILVACILLFYRIEALPVLLAALAVVVLGSAAALYAIRALLKPVSLASDALGAYRERGELPEMPGGADDEAGRLLGEVQGTVGRVDALIRSLRDLSSRDALTDAYNRRACEERLAEDIARVERGGGALTLAVLDVDRLKEINDLYGHEAGDACIRHLADAIERNIRKSDWFARWGGDEFVVVWNAADPEALETMMSRITNDLRRTPVRLPCGEETFITLSAGMSRYEEGEGPWELFARADVALYRAKRGGRDRVAYNE